MHLNPMELLSEDTQALDDEECATDLDDAPTVVLAMRLANLEDAGRTDIGRQRDHNEDCFSMQTEIKKVEGPQGRMVQAKGLYVLCDGMGGHASGEVASAMAVESLKQYFSEQWQDRLPTEEKIREAIQQANRTLFNQNQKNASAGSGRMGTTLVLLLIHDTQAAIAHVGDSRLYRFSRRKGLQQLTVDHEVGQREIQRGVEPGIAYSRPDAYQLTQALGPRDGNFLNPDIKFFELNEDGVLLLCSDGLSDNDLLETYYRSHLEPMLDQRFNLEQGVNQLIDLANQYNGHDNITAIAVRLRVRPNLDQIAR
jgi:protein phosphatase